MNVRNGDHLRIPQIADDVQSARPRSHPLFLKRLLHWPFWPVWPVSGRRASQLVIEGERKITFGRFGRILKDTGSKLRMGSVPRAEALFVSDFTSLRSP